MGEDFLARLRPPVGEEGIERFQASATAIAGLGAPEASA